MEIIMDETIEIITADDHRYYHMNGERPAFEEVIEERGILIAPLTLITRDYATRPEYLYDLAGLVAPADICLDGQVLVPAGEIVDTRIERLIGAAWNRTAGLAEAYRGED